MWKIKANAAEMDEMEVYCFDIIMADNPTKGNN